MARFPKIVDITKGYNKKAIEALKAARDEEARLAAELRAIERLDLPNTQLADQLKTIKLPDVPKPPKSGFEMVGSPYINDSSLVLSKPRDMFSKSVSSGADNVIIPEVLDTSADRVKSFKQMPDIEVDPTNYNLPAVIKPSSTAISTIDDLADNSQGKFSKALNWLRNNKGKVALGAGGAGAVIIGGMDGSPTSEMPISTAVPNQLQTQAENQNKQQNNNPISPKKSEEQNVSEQIAARLGAKSAGSLKDIDFGSGSTIANLQRLQELQEGSRKARLTNELGRAAMAAVTMAGNTKNPFDDILKGQADAADKIPEDYLKQVAFEKEDPNSPMSQGYRNIAKSMGFNIKGNASAADLERLMPQLANIYNQEQAQAARKDEMKLRAAMSADANKAKLEASTTAAQEKNIDKYRKSLDSGTAQKLKSNFNTANRMEKAISEFAKDPTGYSDYATLMGGLKVLQGDESVVRETEIRLGMNAGSLADKIKNYTQQVISGKSLQPGQRDAIIKTVQVMASTAKAQYLNEIGPTITSAKKRKLPLNELVPDEVIAELDRLEQESKKKQDTQATQTSPVGKSGRTPEQRRARILELRSKQGAQ